MNTHTEKNLKCVLQHIKTNDHIVCVQHLNCKYTRRKRNKNGTEIEPCLEMKNTFIYKMRHAENDYGLFYAVCAFTIARGLHPCESQTIPFHFCFHSHLLRDCTIPKTSIAYSPWKWFFFVRFQFFPILLFSIGLVLFLLMKAVHMFKCAIKRK